MFFGFDYISRPCCHFVSKTYYDFVLNFLKIERLRDSLRTIFFPTLRNVENNWYDLTNSRYVMKKSSNSSPTQMKNYCRGVLSCIPSKFYQFLSQSCMN